MPNDASLDVRRYGPSNPVFTVETIDREETPAGALSGSSGRRVVRSSVLLILVLLAHTAFWWFCVDGGWVTVDENGGVENLHALASLGGMFLFGAALRRQTAAHRLLYAGLALLSVTFFLREVDVDDFDLPEAVVWAGSGMGRNLILGTLWCALIVTSTIRLRGVWAAFRVWLRTPTGFLVVTAGAWFVSSMLFDANLFHEAEYTARVWEELLETDGFLLLVAGGIMAAASPARSSGVDRGSP